VTVHGLTILLAAPILALAAQGTSRSTTDRVYTAAQAERGRAHYETTCQPCHGADLRGGVAAALVGDAFVADWSGLGLDRLFDRVRTMPPNTPQRLGDEASADVLAFLLSANGFPSGEEELIADAIEQIRMERSGGVEEVPNFALVQIVGCLTRSADGWIVNAASAPVRTKDPDASAGDERTRAASLPRGQHAFRLLNAYPSPEKLDGHTVEAKGFLIRRPADSINVTSLGSLAPACDR
jgi:S-disulfanyl-L-cysteine oxidoreductase SoxD